MRRAVAAAEFCCVAEASGKIVNAALCLIAPHGSAEVGQMVKLARRPDGKGACCVEAEEKYSRLASVDHVGANVEFWKSRKPRQWRRSMGTNTAHAEGDDSDPALAVEGVEREFLRNQRLNRRERKRPVGKEKVVPRLLHDPTAGGEGPGPMGD